MRNKSFGKEQWDVVEKEKNRSDMKKQMFIVYKCLSLSHSQQQNL